MTLEDVVKDIADTVKESVGEAVAAVKARYDARIKELEDAIAAIPAPEKGEPGKSVTIDDIKPLVEEAVAAIEIPVPADGKDGTNGQNGVDGKDGADGSNGKDGENGKDGKDGIAPTADEVAKSMEGIFSKWALDFERKADGVLSKAIDAIPKPKDGRDALELEDFDLVLDEDGRTVTMSLKRGETVIEKSIKLPIPLDAGVYRDNQAYEKGDGVTYGGCFWIAQKNGPDGKPGSSDDWRMSVKRGRDGRESVKIEKSGPVKV